MRGIGKMEIRENVSLKFTPSFEIIEAAKGGDWLSIGGLALEEGTSENKRYYSINNILENKDKSFKWLFGHPKNDPESHVVGLGKLTEKNGKLFHEGKIRNTANHPDVIEQVRDGFLGPSIHATAKKVTRNEGKYVVEGLSIDGIGLVAFQGVKNASIDYAIAEQFEKKESEDDEKNKMVKKMEDEKDKKKPVVGDAPIEDEKKKEQPKSEVKESVDSIELKNIREELNVYKAERKALIIEKIISLNKDMKSDELVNESEDMLKVILAYESKLAKVAVHESAIAEDDEEVEEGSKKEILVENDDGSVRLTESAWKKFNDEIMNKVM